jgi:aminoglycoside 6-adenylyltransferase
MDEANVLDRLVAWGNAHPLIRAMILTSSRARADATVDKLSDYDVILAVNSVDAFLHDDAWWFGYGRPMVGWGDRSQLYGLTTHFRGEVYEDGAKIDYTVWPVELLDRVAEAATLPDALDVGYRVLLDKDARTKRWKRPTYRAHIPAKPAQDEYRAVVEEFWWDTTYVAKSLWRGDIVLAKFSLDYDMKVVALRRMLEWMIELEHDWSFRPGVFGRGLERLLPPDVSSDLAATYVGADVEENWAALFRTIDLFRRVAVEVGEALGYSYAQDVEDKVTAYLTRVRDLPKTS